LKWKCLLQGLALRERDFELGLVNRVGTFKTMWGLGDDGMHFALWDVCKSLGDRGEVSWVKVMCLNIRLTRDELVMTNCEHDWINRYLRANGKAHLLVCLGGCYQRQLDHEGSELINGLNSSLIYNMMTLGGDER
jgi:hypothetical protein